MRVTDPKPESADITLEPTRPVLVFMPDGDTRVDMRPPLLGHPSATRMARAARSVGFDDIYLAPGTRVVPPGCTELATGEWVGRPALLVYESSYIDPKLLRLMIEHPLEAEERFSLFDDHDRPVGWFTGALRRIPAAMPLSEEIPWPEGLGSAHVARVITGDDVPRMEGLVLACEVGSPPGTSLWERKVDIPLMRVLVHPTKPIEQVELAALVCSVGSGAIALQGSGLGLVCATFCLLLGVEVARVLPALGRLRNHEFSPGRLVPAAVIRPFGHAALIASLTYLLVAQPQRSSVAGLVLLSAGAGAVLLTLAQARVLLRRQVAQPDQIAFELPQSTALASRLGLRISGRYWVPLRLEVLAFVLALTGLPSLPWGVLVAAGLARLWRWFVAPARQPVPEHPEHLERSEHPAHPEHLGASRVASSTPGATTKNPTPEVTWERSAIGSPK